ncbi:MAG: four helix bundle protein, partial [Anaerolineales bacterium]|nr:four helix bundle protein [Anaerolineales bacterium]
MIETAYWELTVYGIAFQSAMHLHNISKAWPLEESPALTGPMRQASRAVCSHIAIAWKKRHDQTLFLSYLSDATASAAETLVWLSFAFECGYLAEKDHRQMRINYDDIDR